MGLEAKLVQKLGQSLLMTPQLQQAIKLLQLGRLEYKEALERELLENPILEESREEGEPPSGQSASADDSNSNPNELPVNNGNTDASDSAEGPKKENTPEWEEFLENLYSEHRGSAQAKGLIDHEDRPSLEATLTRGETLQEHLLNQLRLLDIAQQDKPVIQYLVGNIDKDGYLCVTSAEVAQACQVESDRVDSALNTLKLLDPPGIGARDLKECLLVQLEDMGLGDSLAAKVVQNHLEKLEARKLEAILKAEKVSPEQLTAAIHTIRELEPKPGRQFADETIRYAIPDIYVYKVGNEYVVSLNEEGLPRLRVSPYYLEVLKDSAGASEQKSYLTERLKAAQFLIKSIHQRQQTILKVTQSIVRHQREFLDHGVERMKPLTLREVADDIGMHESTVSRVTTNKFVHTPQGVFELKYFFTTGIRSGEGDLSSSSIKEKIRKIVESESADSPVSDQQIVEMLAAEQIEIARRTVAKYREGMNIPSSSRRKRMF